VHGYTSIAEAVEITNGTPYGVANNTYARDLALAADVAEQIRSGTGKVKCELGGRPDPVRRDQADRYGIERSELAMPEHQFLKHLTLASFPERLAQGC
jgi:hypothetical protein